MGNKKYIENIKEKRMIRVDKSSFSFQNDLKLSKNLNINNKNKF